MFKYGFKLILFVNRFLLTLIVFNSLIVYNVNGYLQIHESSIWIPVINSNIEQPYFMWFQNRSFIQTDYSNRDVNKDTSGVGPGGLVHNFTKSYVQSAGDNLSRLFIQNFEFSSFALNGSMAIQVFNVNRVFESDTFGNMISYRWTPTQRQTENSILFFDRTNFPNSSISLGPTSLSTLFINLVSIDDNNWHQISVDRIDTSLLMIKFIHGFMYHDRTYWFGWQESNNGDIVTTLTELTVHFDLPFATDSIKYVHKELYSTTFVGNYGIPGKVQFISSDLISRNDSSFSNLIGVSYRKNEKDSMVIFELDNFLEQFDQMNQTSCPNTSNTLWPLERLTETRCISSGVPPRIEATLMFFKKYEPNGHILDNILKDDWNRIVDFVPLALEATPGYVFLVLSSNNEYTKYRYSIHSIHDYESIITHPFERIFDLSEPPNSQTKIYYYDIPTPQVLISINQYHYNEPIVLCPFLVNSCLDCLTTRFLDNDQHYKYCSWTNGTTIQSGICSNEDMNTTQVPQSQG